jgi:cell division protein FtsA
VGYPQSIDGLADIVRNPIYSTSVGLLLYGVRHAGETHHRSAPASQGAWWSRLGQWLQDRF